MPNSFSKNLVEVRMWRCQQTGFEEQQKHMEFVLLCQLMVFIKDTMPCCPRKPYRLWLSYGAALNSMGSHPLCCGRC